MKTTFKMMFLAMILIASACKETPRKMGVFQLLPLPQELKITGVSAITPASITKAFSKEGVTLPVLSKLFSGLELTQNEKEANLYFSIDKNLELAAEAYKIDIEENSIHIIAKDDAGLFYAFQTLGQLVEDAQDQQVNLPICSVVDYPKLAYRSIQLDVKHHLETKEYYYGLMDKLASYKINGIIIEVEDKLQYKRVPKVGSLDAFSIEEWRELSQYAKDRFIEISPLVQGLGHSSFVLKHEEYKDLRDNPESDWAYNPLNPETYKVQFNLYLDAMEAFPHGTYLHVGGDEVHTTGRNSGKSALELQLNWLSKVSKFAEEHNRTPIFWDDMPLKEAGVYAAMFNKELKEAEVDSLWQKNEHKLLAFLDRFPKNCIYMRWNYSAAEAIGNQKAMQWFRDQGLQVMGATAGQTRWVLMPQEESNINNIKSFANASIESGLNGLLLTLWDDDSPHFELYMRGILAFSEYAWSGEKRTKEELKSAYRKRQFGYIENTDYAFIDDLEPAVAYWKNVLLEGNSRNYLKGLENPEEKLISLPTEEKGAWSTEHKERLEKTKELLAVSNKVADKIKEAKNSAVRNSHNLAVYEQVNTLVSFSFKALLLLEQYDNATTDKKQQKEALLGLREEFNTIRASFEKVYAKTRQLNKPEGYILDQDDHVHLANQSINFDWQFLSEMVFLEALEKRYTEKELKKLSSDGLLND